MYSAFAEITEYVKANGIGKYTVADIALVEGNGGSTGYYGGWGIIVVYENSKMKWRDVTVFDGHAYVQGNSTSSHQIPISGFNAVQTGQVNVKLGLMAGEGDRSISGDYFNIQRSSDNNWQALNHTGNSTNNFFNSSIQTGGNTRNPNLVNNTGLDISMFNIPNPSNSVITNNQTSTTLRYGSTQDTYVIFMAAMAVDAYIPDPEGVMSLVTINGVPATSTTTVTPGQEIEYSIKLLNEGTENINNAQIKIQLPYTATFVNGSQNGVINFSPLPTPNNIYFNPNDGPSGTLIWDIGTLPVPATPTTVLGELKYKIKITEDCFLLKNQNCVPSASLFGYINGIGAITGIQIINKPFIQGYVTSGLCIGDPILNPITTMIDATNFINQNCQNTITELVFNYCSPISQVPFNSIASNYPIGTQFYNSYPVNGSTIEYTNSNPFPNTLGSFNYYAVPPNANGCYYTLKINIVGSPTITSPQAVNILSCSTNTITELPISTTPVSITLQDFINIGGSVSNNSLSYTISYVDVITGSCPTVINRSYTLTTLCVTTNLTQVFTIERPDFTLPANTTSTVACAADIVAPSVPVVTDNCGNVLVASAPSISANPTCEGNVTYTYTFTDCEGNSHNWIHTFTIEHSDFTLPANTTSTVACAADIVAPTVPVVTDNCGNVLVASAPSISASPTCEGNVTYTYTFTDCEGNTHNWIHTFTIEHSDFTLPANTTSTVACAADIVAPSVPVVTDNCGNVLVASAPSISASPTCEGNVTYTYTFTDCEGNTHNWIHTFTIEHSDFTLPANTSSTVACAADIVAPSVPVVTDNCGNVLVASAPSISASPTCEGNVTYTYTFTDCEGNTHNWIHTFTIDDTSPPTGIAPSDILDLQCTSEIPVADINLVTDVTDNCSGTVTVTVTVTVSETNNEGSGCNGNPLIITRTYTLTDCSGLTTNLIQTIRVEDNTAPIFTSELPQDISVSCDAIPNPAEMTGSDNCSDVTITVLDTIDREESQCAGEYIISRTWTITDSCNNSSSYTQTITVFDNTPPILSTPLDTEISVSCSEIPAVPELEFSDNCSGIQDVVYNETSTIISIYAYVIVREWVVSDNCGNEASFTQTINVSVEEPFDAIPFAICIEDDPIDLFTILDDSIPTTGEWHEVTSSGGLTGSIFDPTNVTLGFYTLQYVVELGDNTCPMIYEVYLNVNDDCVVLAACDITVYNAVSPNDDGSNDFFFIDGLECYPDNTVEIYNRWGILVYDERGYDNNLKSFKGISEGRSTVNKNELLPDGTYFYILKYTDEENKKHDRSGYLYLNR